MAILRDYADKFERWGLDEAFLDVTSRIRNFDEGKKLAGKIKKEVYEK
jgi:DNA polymerase IV (DinB-like DNA polymerase)